MATYTELTERANQIAAKNKMENQAVAEAILEKFKTAYEEVTKQPMAVYSVVLPTYNMLAASLIRKYLLEVKGWHKNGFEIIQKNETMEVTMMINRWYTTGD